MTLPILGAAFVSTDMLELHRHWLLAAPRDIEMQMFVWPGALDGDTGPHVARLTALLDGTTGRRGLHGPFMGFKIDCPDPALITVIQGRLLTTLDLCVALKADQMVVHSPVSTWDDSNHAVDPAHWHKQIERTRTLMAPVVRRAEDNGIEIVIENIEDMDPLARLALANALESRAVAVSLDTGHAQYAHVMTGGPAVDAYVHAAGNRLHHVHLQDSDGFADRHWHPGEGSLPWKAIFAALNRLPEMPRLILEVKDQIGIPIGADYLAQMGLAA